MGQSSDYEETVYFINEIGSNMIAAKIQIEENKREIEGLLGNFSFLLAQYQTVKDRLQSLENQANRTDNRIEFNQARIESTEKNLLNISQDFRFTKNEIKKVSNRSLQDEVKQETSSEELNRISVLLSGCRSSIDRIETKLLSKYLDFIFYVSEFRHLLKCL